MNFEDWLQHRAEVKSKRVRLGLQGYAMVCAALRDNPETVRGLVLRAGLGRTAAYRVLSSLHSLKLAHIVDWRMYPRLAPLPVYAYGPGEDKPPPKLRPNGNESRARPAVKRHLCPAVIAFAHVLRAIESPVTRLEVTAATGLDTSTALNALNALTETGLAHISGWSSRDQGGALLPLWVKGAGRNAPKPSSAKLQREYEARKVERQIERRRHQSTTARIAAVFGPALSATETA